MIFAGMDEAGRGPALGPIVFGIVLATEEQCQRLIEMGVDDSKKLSPQRRMELKQLIITTVSEYGTYFVPAQMIDEMREEMTMNELEVVSFRKLLKPFAEQVDVLQLDAADVNAERFGLQFKDMVTGKIQSEHKGDQKFVSVAAASILAKISRDQHIEEFQQEMDKFDPTLPSFGSGYPTQAKPFLEAYVEKYHKLPVFARASWETCRVILEKVIGTDQSSLDDFL